MSNINLYLFLRCQSDAGDSDASDAVVSLHSTESGEHRLCNYVDEAHSAYSSLQELINCLSGTIRQAVSCYDLKLYVVCFTVTLYFLYSVDF